MLEMDISFVMWGRSCSLSDKSNFHTSQDYRQVFFADRYLQPNRKWPNFKPQTDKSQFEWKMRSIHRTLQLTICPHSQTLSHRYPSRSPLTSDHSEGQKRRQKQADSVHDTWRKQWRSRFYETSKMLELRMLGLRFEMRRCGDLVESAPARCVRIASLGA